MREVLIGAAVVLGLLVAGVLALCLFLWFCRWRIRRLEAKMEQIEPGSVARLKAAALCKEFARRLNESEDE